MESFNFYVTVTEAFECYLLGLSSGRLDNGILTVDTSSHIAKERIRIGRPDVSSPEDLTVPDGVECTLNIPRLAVLSTSAQVQVSDSKGGPVFRVKFSYTPDRDGTRLVLSNPSGDVTFATASDSRTVKPEGSFPQQRAALSITNPKEGLDE
eukprot:g25592.t1